MNIEAKLRRAGMGTAVGLLISVLSLIPLHPLAFIVFVGVGMPVTAWGVIYFLLALLNDAGTALSDDTRHPKAE